jgi:3-methyladenine DNA glycosylase AlkD
MARSERLRENERVGIENARALGITIPELGQLARRVGQHHELAEELWATAIHEARILAAMVDEPGLVTNAQMEGWVLDFDSWDLCDGVCGLFEQTPVAWEKAVEWAAREEEFVRRAGFVLMCYLAMHDKQAGDERYLAFLPVIRRYATDERNFVKKAVNWALRQIGKRNRALNAAAIATGEAIRADGSRSGRWIAADALRELRGEAVQRRLKA